MTTQLPMLPLDDPAWDSSDGDFGEVFTRPWVVDFILDLAGYTPEKDLATLVAVEPACGAGAFLEPMVVRLVESCRRHARTLDQAIGAIQAFDLLPSNVELARKTVAATLASTETGEDAGRLASAWVHEGDFLLVEHDGVEADFVLGNPPYLRLGD